MNTTPLFTIEITRNLTMKKITQISMLLLGLMVVFTGCDAATEVANKAKDSVGDMANIDFGDFDMAGLKEKFTGVTDGFKDVTAENVDGLTSKISDLGTSVEEMGETDLGAPAKTAVGTVIATFKAAVTKAMEGISDEGILGKLKPAVDGLMEKLDGFAG
jgi:hypothetical protein